MFAVDIQHWFGKQNSFRNARTVVFHQCVVYCLLETVCHTLWTSITWLKHVVKDNYRARARVTDSNTTTTPKPLLTIRRQQALGIFFNFVLFWKAALIASPPSCSLLKRERNDHQWGMPWGSLGFTLRGTDDISSSRFKGLSSLFEVVARHTLEMIPESMILMKNVTTLGRTK